MASRILSSTLPPRLPVFVKPASAVYSLAKKTNETVSQFAKNGLHLRYCGPFATYNFLNLIDTPPRIPSLLKHFDIDKINNQGTHADSIRSTLESISKQKINDCQSLSQREIERILSKGFPITTLVKQDSENHWTNLVGYDDTHYHLLDYHDVVPVAKNELLPRCLRFIYEDPISPKESSNERFSPNPRSIKRLKRSDD